GLGDLDGHGSAMMILLLGHNMLRRCREGAPLRALIPYVFWALVTGVRHPVALWRIARNARYWFGLARSQLVQRTVS
ncbi:hypothetical protein DKX15_19830, partial [Enterococcus faecium]